MTHSTSSDRKLMGAVNEQGTGNDQGVVIVGLGMTGLSCVTYFLNKGITPVVVDSRERPPGEDKLPPSVTLYRGHLHPEVLLAARQIILSPGIALATPEIDAAIKAGVEVIGDIELFAREAKAPIIAITGSNGKSTVTTLVGEMAQAAGINVAIGGNIGIPALSLLDVSAPYELYVLELSSFQLETTSSLRAAAATVLNVSDDHLDRYPDFEAYRQAKLSIYHNAVSVISNRDDPLTLADSEYTPSHQANHSFGMDGDDYGLITENGTRYLAYQGQLLISEDELKIKGTHNLMNALAAIALLDAVGADRELSFTGLRQFGGLAHRCEFIRQVNGVTWINDTKATNVGATLAALEGLRTSVKGRLYLIAGGEGKGADFMPLRAPFTETIDRIYCFGKDRQALAALSENTVIVDDLTQAVDVISKIAIAEDWVLLSPACASLDMYPNYMARGDHFRSLVEAL